MMERTGQFARLNTKPIIPGITMRGVLVLSVFLLTSSAFAYEAPLLHSFAKPTAKGKYVLVMLQPQERPVEKGLKEKYGRNGLYPTNDPTKPLWTCDWGADWERNVFASDDGIYAVRVPNGDPGGRTWALMHEDFRIPAKKPGWEDAPALYISDRGQPFRTLVLKDVFECSRFTDRDCFMGPIVTIDSFDDAAGRVVISAEANERKQTATVAFRTGEVVERTGGAGGTFGFLSTNSGVGGGQGGWGRAIFIGVVVVGLCAATFVGAAVLLIRNQRTRKV